MSDKTDTYRIIDILGLCDEAYIRFAEAVLECRALPEGMTAALHELYEGISIRSIGSNRYILPNNDNGISKKSGKQKGPEGPFCCCACRYDQQETLSALR